MAEPCGNWRKGILLTAAALALAGCGEPKELWDVVHKSGELIIAVDPGFPPLSMVNNRGDVAGFDVDVGREVARRLGVNVKFVTPKFDLVVSGNWADRWHVSIGSVARTEARERVLRFTDCYYYGPAHFAVHKDNTLFTTIADLAAKKVGVCKASSYQAYLEGTLKLPGGAILAPPPLGAKLVGYDTDDYALNDLALGDGVRLHAALTGLPTILHRVKNGSPLRRVPEPAFYEALAFALDKQRQGPTDKLLELLNKTIAEMHEDGTLSKLSIQWIGEDLTKPPAPPAAGAAKPTVAP